MRYMKLIMQHIAFILHKTMDLISTEIHIYQKERNNRNDLYRKIKKQEIIYTFMERLAEELAQAFAGKNYPCTEKIYSPLHLRIIGPRETSQGIIYTFSIAKNTAETVRDIFLADIRENMNRDIYDFWHRACEIFGTEYVNYSCPIIAAGVNVVNVRDSGSGDILITVHTNMPPIQ